MTSQEAVVFQRSSSIWTVRATAVANVSTRKAEHVSVRHMTREPCSAGHAKRPFHSNLTGTRPSLIVYYERPWIIWGLPKW